MLYAALCPPPPTLARLSCCRPWLSSCRRTQVVAGGIAAYSAASGAKVAVNSTSLLFNPGGKGQATDEWHGRGQVARQEAHSPSRTNIHHARVVCLQGQIRMKGWATACARATLHALLFLFLRAPPLPSLGTTPAMCALTPLPPPPAGRSTAEIVAERCYYDSFSRRFYVVGFGSSVSAVNRCGVRGAGFFCFDFQLRTCKRCRHMHLRPAHMLWTHMP